MLGPRHLRCHSRHSERRSIYGESDEVINENLLALKHDMNVVFCIGETLEERESDAGRGPERQVRRAHGSRPISEEGHTAYEPVWAIEQEDCNPDDANDAHAFVRRVVETLLQGCCRSNCNTVWWFSSLNAKVLCPCHIDGALSVVPLREQFRHQNFDK